MKAALAVLAVLTTVGAAEAHSLSVFAFVEDGIVTVESRFSNGNIPSQGEVRVLDQDNTLVHDLTLAEDGTASFPLDPAAAGGGLMIEVVTGEGHENYWILTPEDIARGSED